MASQNVVERAPIHSAPEAGLLEDIERLIVNPAEWMNTPHPELEGHAPAEFLTPGKEQPLRDLLGAIKYGLFA